MALQTFSFKIDDNLDPDVIAWLKASENRSIDIRKALRHYLDLPPRDEAPAPAPSPIDSVALTSALTTAIKDGFKQAATEAGTSIGKAVAKEIKRVTHIRFSENELGSFEDWANEDEEEEIRTTADELAMQTEDPDATFAATGLFLNQFG